MKFIAVHEEGIGLNFPKLDEELQYTIFKERKDDKLKLLIRGIYRDGFFRLEYSKNTNYLLITIFNETLQDEDRLILVLYTSLKEALTDLEKILKVLVDARYWSSLYYDREFVCDYVDLEEDHSKMIWRKKGIYWIAQGKNGKFMIKQLHRTYIGRYEGKTTSFNMPSDKYISKLKAKCEENAYWE